jgi:hypothetical protein
MEFYGETNKKKFMQVLLICLQYGSRKRSTWDGIQKKMKLENIDDARKLRSCVDLIEDTEDAIINFSKYKLTGREQNSDLGETYLRFYGVLNAVYLQKNAIVEISEIVKHPEKKLILSKLSDHQLLEIRNIIGSHMVNFVSDKTKNFKTKNNKNYFFLIQSELKDDGSHFALTDGNKKYKTFNLNKLLKSYNRISENLLIGIIEKYISTLFKDNPRLNEELYDDLSRMKKPSDYEKFNIIKKEREKIKKEINKIIKKNMPKV